jgi:hypothetical protein
MPAAGRGGRFGEHLPHPMVSAPQGRRVWRLSIDDRMTIAWPAAARLQSPAVPPI